MAGDTAPRDQNRNVILQAASTVDNASPVNLWADPVTHLLQVSSGGGGGGNVNLTQVGSSNITLGQKTMANSLPVVIASDQSAVPVTLTSTTVTGTVAVTQSTSPWVVSNGGTFAVQATLAAETTKVIGTVNVAAAQTIAVTQATGTNLHTVLDSGTLTTLTTLTGTTTLTPGTGAANLGKAEDAAHASGDTGVAAWGVRNDNLATTYGNDQDYGPLATDLNGRVMVAQKAATATLSNVSTSGTTANLLAANSARIGATITNEATTVLYVKFGTTASATSYTVTLAGAASAPYSYYEVPAGYTGRIDGILASSTGTARVTELT